MALHLVRHALSVERRTWPEDDALRPLAEDGTRQAHALARSAIVGDGARVLSSPARRCIDTVAPLARRIGVSVDVREELFEGCGASALAAVRAEARAGDVVACTHGDVVAALLQGFVYEDDLVLPDDVRWGEASTWTVTFDDAGRASEARYRPVSA